MIKNLKLALGLGAGYWAIMFIGVSALMVMPIPILAQNIASVILAGVAGFILARVYFDKNPGDIKDGVILGVLWFVASTALDLLVTIQYVKAGGSYIDGLKVFYSMWNFWVGFLLMIGGVVLAAKITHGGELAKQVAPSNQGGPSQPSPTQQPQAVKRPQPQQQRRAQQRSATNGSYPSRVSSGKPPQQKPPAPPAPPTA